MEASTLMLGLTTFKGCLVAESLIFFFFINCVMLVRKEIEGKIFIQLG